MNQTISAYLTSCAITVAYVPTPNGIKTHVVHPNELHRAQPTKSIVSTSAATNSTG